MIGAGVGREAGVSAWREKIGGRPSSDAARFSVSKPVAREPLRRNSRSNRARILATAREELGRNPDVTLEELAEKARLHCEAAGVDIGQLAVQYSIENPDIATCMIGSANPDNVRKWVEWADAPIDRELMAEVIDILRPIHNWHHIEGRPENNDKPGRWAPPQPVNA